MMPSKNALIEIVVVIVVAAICIAAFVTANAACKNAYGPDAHIYWGSGRSCILPDGQLRGF